MNDLFGTGIRLPVGTLFSLDGQKKTMAVAVIVTAAVAAVLFLTTVACTDMHNSESSSTYSQLLEPWQECSIFLAPSSSGGFGVFAARDFQKDEIVEIAPFFLAVEDDVPYVMNTALQDYIYGYHRERYHLDNNNNNTTLEPPQVLSAIVWGMTMIYNHHSESPNIQWATFGFEPTTIDDPHAIRVVEFHARRDIAKGEELFSTYGIEDGGAKWFRERHLTMMTSATPNVTRIIPNDQLQQYQHEYCSKIYADMDDYIYTTRLAHLIPLPNFYNISRLAPTTLFTKTVHDYDNPHYPWAHAKVFIHEGDAMEVAPALVLDRHMILHTPLAPLVYYWWDLSNDLQRSVQELRQQGYYVVQYQGDSTQWRREDHFRSFEDSVILPVGGWIGRVQRVGGGSDNNTTANCKLIILSSDFYQHQNNTNATTAAAMTRHDGTLAQSRQGENQQQQNPFATGNAGIVLKLIATRDIAVGERLRVNMPPAGTFRERLALYKEMEQSGQIYTLPDHDEYHYDDDQHHEFENENEQGVKNVVRDEL
jgi:hypothetical protein